MAGTTPVSVGLLPTEQLVRGGASKLPTLLTGLLLHRGEQFVKLVVKRNPLRMFVLRPGRQERLAAKKVFEEITDLYEKKVEESLKALACADKAAVSVEEPETPAEKPVDKTALLGLDGPAPAPASAGVRRSKRQEQQARSQLPATVTVPWAFEDETWDIECLVHRKGNGGVRKAAAIACTEGNLTNLRRACLQACSTSSAGQPGPLLPLRRSSAAKAPKKSKHGVQEYWNAERRRWIARVPEVSGGPGTKRVRTLTRRATSASTGEVLSACHAAVVPADAEKQSALPVAAPEPRDSQGSTGEPSTHIDSPSSANACFGVAQAPMDLTARLGLD